MKKIRWIAVGLVLLSILTGCGDRRELNELGIIGAVAYDNADGETTVWMDVLQQEEETPRLMAGTGPGCQEAYEDANEKLDRQLYPSHIRVHLFGEDYAKRGLAQASDMVLRDQAFRLDVPMLVVQGGRADKTLQTAAKQGAIESENLYGLLHENARLGRTVETSVLDFIKQTRTPGIHPLVGCVKVEQKEDGNAEVACSGAAIFSNDQLLGFLDEKQTLACQLVRGTPVRSSLYLNKSGTSVEIESKKTTKRVSGEKAEVFIVLDVSVTGKQNTMDTEALVQEVQEELQQAVLQTVLDMQQSYGIDIFGFGGEVRGAAADPSQWDRVFAKMKMDVTIETRLKSAGQAIQ